MKINKKCAICGTPYSYCSGCKADIDMPRWKFLFHDEKCKKIYDIINAYKTSEITKEQAKNRLGRFEMPDIVSGFKVTVDEIMGINEKKEEDDVQEQ